LLTALDRRGIAVTVVADGAHALIEIGRLTPATLLVSANLPVVDGVTVVRAVRNLPDRADLRILLAVGVDDHRQAAAGLAAGASACVGKPYRVNEVLALVGADTTRGVAARTGVGLGMRPSVGVGDAVLRAGDVSLDLGAYEVRVAGVPVRLPPQEFRLLQALLERAGLVVTRETLLEQVWGIRDSETNTLAVHIRRLRRRLGEASDEPQLIESIRGVGYRFRLPGSID
jgi:DNA-binding response OmpR family regulator